jgi:hypothetical protein
VEGLLAIKQGYAHHAAGAPSREKDIMDIHRLHVFMAKGNYKRYNLMPDEAA